MSTKDGDTWSMFAHLSDGEIFRQRSTLGEVYEHKNEQQPPFIDVLRRTIQCEKKPGSHWECLLGAIEVVAAVDKAKTDATMLGAHLPLEMTAWNRSDALKLGKSVTPAKDSGRKWSRGHPTTPIGSGKVRVVD